MPSLNDLPEELLIQVMKDVDVITFLCCRRVSKTLKDKLDSHQLIREFIRDKFPLMYWGRWLENLAKTRERYSDRLRAVEGAAMGPDRRAEHFRAVLRFHSQRVFVIDWVRVLLDTARRQLSVETATYGKRTTFPGHGGDLLFCPVIPWGVSGPRPHHDLYADPAWAYDAETSTLFHFSQPHGAYLAYNFDLGRAVVCPFPTQGRIIRRVRAAKGLVVFEWAERAADFTPPSEHRHRHWITVYDYWLCPEFAYPDRKAPAPGRVDPNRPIYFIAPRHQWCIRDEGFVIADDGGDVFFTAHNATHFVLYACAKAARGIKRVAENIRESVFIWDIRRAPGKLVPDLARTVDVENLVLKDVHRGRDGGRPRFLGVGIDPVTVGSTGQLRGRVYFHTEHRNAQMHRVSSIGLAIDDEHDDKLDTCVRPCHDEDPMDPRDMPLRRPDLEPGAPRHAQHWRASLEEPFSTSMEAARMHDGMAGLSVAFVWKMTMKRVAVSTVFSRVIEPVCDYQHDRRWGITRNRLNWGQVHFLGRFFIAGDQERLMGEDEHGNIDVYTF